MGKGRYVSCRGNHHGHDRTPPELCSLDLERGGIKNDSVRQYNTGLRRFPGNLVASSMGLSQFPYYEVPKEKKDVPKVKF